MFASRTVGDENIRGVSEFPVFTKSVRLTPLCAFEPGRFLDPLDSASPAVGVGKSTASARVGRVAAFGLGLRFVPLLAHASGVGQLGDDEDTKAEMWGTEEGCRYTVPLRIVPESGQVSEYVAHSSNKEPWDVLHEDVAGSKYAKDACELGPEPSLVVLSASLSGEANGLTRESSADKIHSESCPRHCPGLDEPLWSVEEGVGQKPFRVIEPLHVRPVLLQHEPTVRIDLDLPRAFHSGTLEAQVEPTDAGEE